MITGVRAGCARTSFGAAHAVTHRKAVSRSVAQSAGQVGRGNAHGEGMACGERPLRFRRESVTAVPQLEDGQLRLGRVRVHDPVRGDAEPLVRRFLPVQVDEGGARRPDLNHLRGSVQCHRAQSGDRTHARCPARGPGGSRRARTGRGDSGVPVRLSGQLRGQPVPG